MHNANLLYSYCKRDEQILSNNLSCTVSTYCILVWIIESCNMDENSYDDKRIAPRIFFCDYFESILSVSLSELFYCEFSNYLNAPDKTRSIQRLVINRD